MNLVRIATVNKTGQRYVVQQLDFRTNRCHCWGELMSYDTKKCSRTFEGAKVFDLAEVTIAKDIPLTTKLLDELFDQSVQAHAQDVSEGKLVLRQAKYRK